MAPHTLCCHGLGYRPERCLLSWEHCEVGQVKGSSCSLWFRVPWGQAPCWAPCPPSHLSLTQPCQHPSIQVKKGRFQEAKGFARTMWLQNTRVSTGTQLCLTHRPNPSQGKGDERPHPSQDLVIWMALLCVCAEGLLS